MQESTTDISSYRLTIIAAIVIIVLSGALVIVFTPTQAPQYLTLIGTVAIPGLFALFKLEQNIKVNTVRHEENKAALSKLVTDNQTIGDAIRDIHTANLPVEQAALKVSGVLASDPAAKPADK